MRHEAMQEDIMSQSNWAHLHYRGITVMFVPVTSLPRYYI